MVSRFGRVLTGDGLGSGQTLGAVGVGCGGGDRGKELADVPDVGISSFGCSCLLCAHEVGVDVDPFLLVRAWHSEYFFDGGFERGLIWCWEVC